MYRGNMRWRSTPENDLAFFSEGNIHSLHPFILQVIQHILFFRMCRVGEGNVQTIKRYMGITAGSEKSHISEHLI